MSIKEERKQLQRSRSKAGHDIKRLHRAERESEKLIGYDNKVRTSKSAFAVLATIAFGVGMMWMGASQFETTNAQAEQTAVTQDGQAQELCGLDSVVCPSEVTERRWRTVTAYNTVPEQTDSSPCIAASGIDICEGMAQGKKYVATNELAFGTKVKISGQVYVVVDRTNARYSHRYDIAMPADQIAQAREWGSRTLLVDIVN